MATSALSRWTTPTPSPPKRATSRRPAPAPPAPHARPREAPGPASPHRDEPYLQAHPDKARRYGVEAIDRALAGVDGPPIVHMCFGYAYVVKDKPSGYSFLPELDRCRAAQISIE